MRFDKHKPDSLFETYANFHTLNEAKGGIPSNAKLSDKQKWKDASELGKPGRYPYISRTRGKLSNAVQEYGFELKVMVRKELFPDEHKKRFKDRKKEAIVDKEVDKRMKTMFLGYKGEWEDSAVQWNWDSGKKMFVKDEDSVKTHNNEKDMVRKSAEITKQANDSGDLQVMERYFESMRQEALGKIYIPVDGNDSLAYAHADLYADEKTVEKYPDWSIVWDAERKTARRKLTSTESWWPGSRGVYDDHYEKVNGKWVGKKWRV